MHKTYREIGLAVTKVWKYFELHKVGAYLAGHWIIPEDKVNPDSGNVYGTGKGYRQTIYIILAITGTIIAVIITLGILRYISKVPDPTSSLIHTAFGI